MRTNVWVLGHRNLLEVLLPHAHEESESASLEHQIWQDEEDALRKRYETDQTAMIVYGERPTLVCDASGFDAYLRELPADDVAILEGTDEEAKWRVEDKYHNRIQKRHDAKTAGLIYMGPVLPVNYRFASVPVKVAYSFDQYAVDILGWEKDISTGRYGKWTNPNGWWKSFRVGGRFANAFIIKDGVKRPPIEESVLTVHEQIDLQKGTVTRAELRPHGRSDFAYEEDIDWDAMFAPIVRTAMRVHEACNRVFWGANKDPAWLTTVKSRSSFPTEEKWVKSQEYKLLTKPVTEALAKLLPQEDVIQFNTRIFDPTEIAKAVFSSDADTYADLVLSESLPPHIIGVDGVILSRADLPTDYPSWYALFREQVAELALLDDPERRVIANVDLNLA